LFILLFLNLRIPLLDLLFLLLRQLFGCLNVAGQVLVLLFKFLFNRLLVLDHLVGLGCHLKN
jgi:hypothetical protein